jgi:hypothetical protein
MLGRRFHFLLIIWTTLAIALVLALSEYALLTGPH